MKNILPVSDNRTNEQILAEMAAVAARIEGDKTNNPEWIGLRNILVQKNVGLIVPIAKAYPRIGVELRDLVQAGVFGLIFAAEKFDSNNRASFSNYSQRWIRGAISAAVSSSGIIRIPKGTLKKVAGLTRAEQLSLQEPDRDPNQDEINELSARFGDIHKSSDWAPSSDPKDKKRITELDVRFIQGNRTESLGSSKSRSKVIKSAEAPAELVAHVESSETLAIVIETVLGSLTGKAAEVIRLRYLTDNPLTQEEVGRLRGVTKQSIQLLEARALKRIREHPRYGAVLANYIVARPAASKKSLGRPKRQSPHSAVDCTKDAGLPSL